MKKAMFGAIFAALLVLSLPVVSTVQAGPELIAKNSNERYVPEFVKAILEEMRSIVDRIMEIAGDNGTIARECKEMYDALDDMEKGRVPTTSPLSAPALSTEELLSGAADLIRYIREYLGDDIADGILSQINKELNPLFSPIFGRDFSASELILGNPSESFYEDIAGTIPYPGHLIHGENEQSHFISSPTPAMPCPVVTGNPSVGGVSTTDWSENCTYLAIQWLAFLGLAIIMWSILTLLAVDCDVGTFAAVWIIYNLFSEAHPLLFYVLTVGIVSSALIIEYLFLYIGGSALGSLKNVRNGIWQQMIDEGCFGIKK